MVFHRSDRVYFARAVSGAGGEGANWINSYSHLYRFTKCGTRECFSNKRHTEAVPR